MFPCPWSFKCDWLDWDDVLMLEGEKLCLDAYHGFIVW